MRAWFQKLTDVSFVAQDDGYLKEALAELPEELGYECYAYLNVRPARTFAISNYPEEWQRRYLSKGYATIDPVVATARARMEAFYWSAGSPRRVRSSDARKFFTEAGDFGIRSGITIPVRTAFGHMSMLTLASNKPSLSPNRDIDQIAAVTGVAYLHAALEQLDTTPSAASSVALTAKQTLCLKWSAEGKTMRDIATIENLSYATVNFHLNNARKALDATSLAHATYLAAKLKLI